VSDYLSEEEQLSRLYNWWKQNGAAVIVGLVLAIAGVLGWRWYQSYDQERVTAASDLYAEYLAANGAARDALAKDIVAGGDATAYPALVLLRQAEAAVAAGDLAGAEKPLSEAIESASGAVLADLARLRLARVQHGLGRHDDALATLGQVRSPGYLPLAQELKGDIHMARNERAQAHEAYVAALGEVLADDQRALLEIKVADTADASDS
jgi:predicted negative regulator of RcsB-dependent stress response